MAEKNRSNLRSGDETAYRILSRREHSTQQLRLKLQHRGFAEAEINATIAKCTRLGFLDDERWAQAAVREAVRKGKGPIYIRKLLEINGIDPERKLSIDQTAQIARLVQGPLGKKERRKVWAALLRRGFEADAIREGLQKQ